jgi:uncharacterized membrane protein YeaQ/YmgE (transglycosylase-associated protein family)
MPVSQIQHNERSISMNIILFLLIGALAGWLAGQIMKGEGFGFLGNMLVGVIGAFLGGFLFDIIGVHGQGLVASLFTAVIGAVVLLFIVGQIKK